MYDYNAALVGVTFLNGHCQYLLILIEQREQRTEGFTVKSYLITEKNAATF